MSPLGGLLLGLLFGSMGTIGLALEVLNIGTIDDTIDQGHG